MDMSELMAEMQADPTFGEVMKAMQGASEAEPATLLRIEAKLDRLLAFDAVLAMAMGPMLPKKFAGMAKLLRETLE